MTSIICIVLPFPPLFFFSFFNKQYYVIQSAKPPGCWNRNFLVFSIWRARYKAWLSQVKKSRVVLSLLSSALVTNQFRMIWQQDGLGELNWNDPYPYNTFNHALLAAIPNSTSDCRDLNPSALQQQSETCASFFFNVYPTSHSAGIHQIDHTPCFCFTLRILQQAEHIPRCECTAEHGDRFP